MNNKRVATQWIAGKSGTGSHMYTDGASVWSYGKRIGYTAEDGRKVAIDCHYSNSTATHSGLAVRVAAVVEPCRCCAVHVPPDLTWYRGLSHGGAMVADYADGRRHLFERAVYADGVVVYQARMLSAKRIAGVVFRAADVGTGLRVPVSGWMPAGVFPPKA